MAKIPTLRTTRVSTEVGRTPTGSIASAGLVEQAGAKLAGQVAELGFKILEKRKKAATDNFVNSSLTDLKRSQVDAKKEANTFFSGSDYEGYAADIDSSIQERIETALETAPNDDARQLFKLRANSLQTQSFLSNTGFENASRAQFYLNKHDENRETMQKVHFDSGDFDSLQKDLDDNEIEIKQSFDLFGEQGVRQRLDNNFKNTTSLLDGILSRKDLSELQTGQDFINGENPDYSRALNGLPSAVKARYIDRFKNQIKHQSNLAVAETVLLSNDVSAAVKLSCIEESISAA